ncbi:MAG: cytochrome c oxidase subunit II [Haloferacaceae archaeon]
MGIDIVPTGSQQEVFNQLFWVFTGLGTLVGTIVIGYLFWNSYRYRAGQVDAEDLNDVFRPKLGVLPSADHGGRHLLFSFSISALIVVSLIGWTYGSLLFLAQGSQPQAAPTGAQDQMEVTVTGHQFYWEFTYHDVPGHEQSVSTRNELVIPTDTHVRLRVTSADVFHNFGIPELKVKADSIPGQTTSTWVVEDEQGTYIARCYELCGSGHSFMKAQVRVVGQESFDEWYAEQESANANATANASANATGA